MLLDQAVTPLEPLLEAGLLVIAPRTSGAGRFPVVALPSQERPEEAEAVVESAIEEMRRRGILAGRDEFNAGEGI